MSEFFLEIFSEEIPANLQKAARTTLLGNFTKLFEEKKISFKKNLSYSVPNRLIIFFDPKYPIDDLRPPINLYIMFLRSPLYLTKPSTPSGTYLDVSC